MSSEISLGDLLILHPRERLYDVKTEFQDKASSLDKLRFILPISFCSVEGPAQVMLANSTVISSCWFVIKSNCSIHHTVFPDFKRAASTRSHIELSLPMRLVEFEPALPLAAPTARKEKNYVATTIRLSDRIALQICKFTAQ